MVDQYIELLYRNFEIVFKNSMTNKKLIHITGIPLYNDEKYLDKAILSVFNQTFIDWNLFLIDDGSTDNSLSIARKYLEDDRVKFCLMAEIKSLHIDLMN
jgi:cellulose synthase/poly-beta-1,6-N-acetylglucosamine synthase-like glycosyltransferase